MLYSVNCVIANSMFETVLDSASGRGTVLESATSVGQCCTVLQAWDSAAQCYGRETVLDSVSERGTVLDSASKCDMYTMGTITLVM